MWDVVSWLSGAARGHHVLRYPKILLQESNLSGWEVTRCNSVFIFPCRQWEIYSWRKPSIACETSISRNQWYYEEKAKWRSNNFWQRLTFDIKCKIDLFFRNEGIHVHLVLFIYMTVHLVLFISMYISEAFLLVWEYPAKRLQTRFGRTTCCKTTVSNTHGPAVLKQSAILRSTRYFLSIFRSYTAYLQQTAQHYK